MEGRVITLGWVTIILAIWGVAWATVWSVFSHSAKQRRIHIEKQGMWIIFWFSLSAVAIALFAFALEEAGAEKQSVVIIPSGIAGCILLVIAIWTLINPHPDRIKGIYWPAVMATLAVGISLLILPALLKDAWLLWFALFWLLLVSAIQVFVHLKRLLGNENS
ncbi:hypothetical protein [Thiogranum longum]|nr:hypothetical protein [Thiogranum longum]